MTHTEAIQYLKLAAQEYVNDVQANRPALAIALANHAQNAVEAVEGALKHYDILIQNINKQNGETNGTD